MAAVAATPVQEAPPTKRPSLLWPTIGAAAALAVLIGAFLYFRPKPAPPAPEAVRFEIAEPPNVNLSSALSLSPDGRKLAFIALGSNSGSRLWVRTLANLESRPLQGTDGIIGVPFWSPDSRYIVFDVGGKLMKIEANGGPPLTLCDAPRVLLGGFWTSDDKIVFGQGPEGLLQVPAGGGQASAFTNDRRDAFPSLLPGGRNFVYSRLSNLSPDREGIYLGSIEGKSEERNGKKLLADRSPAAFAPSTDPALGYILFVRAPGNEMLGTLMAQPFDNRKLELAGDAVPVAEQVSKGGFSASTTGVLVYGTGPPIVPSIATGNSVRGQLTWFDRQGNVLSTVAEPGVWQTLSLSPDNTKLAFSRDVRGNTDIWVYEFARGVTTRLTSDPGTDLSPVWNADGSRVAFMSTRQERGIYQRASNGAGEEGLLLKRDRGAPTLTPTAQGWSRDGRFMLLSTLPRGGPTSADQDLWVLPLGGATSGEADRKAVILLQTEFAERGARFSPDNRWFSYTSNKSGKDEAYVRAFDPAFVPGSGNPSPGGEFIVSKGGGISPHWRGDSREIFDLAPDGTVMSVDVTASPEFKAGVPKPLFKGPPGVTFWDVSNDGKRFLMPVAGGTVSGTPAPYKVVLNWTSTLKK